MTIRVKLVLFCMVAVVGLGVMLAVLFASVGELQRRRALASHERAELAALVHVASRSGDAMTAAADAFERGSSEGVEPAVRKLEAAIDALRTIAHGAAEVARFESIALGAEAIVAAVRSAPFSHGGDPMRTMRAMNVLGRERVFDQTVALMDEEIVLAAQSDDDALAALATLRTLAVAMPLGLLLLLTISTLAFVPRFARGTRALERAAQQMAAGDLHATVPAGGLDELARVGAAFNQMSESLRNTRAELVGARERAEQSDRAKSEFLANMSHEIRTPLSGVLGYADLLIDGDIDASSRLNYVQTIRRNGEHLLNVINDVLDLAKIEAGMMTAEKVACSPAQIVVDVASLMRVRATEKGIGLQVRFATPVPATIQTDPTRLRQILMNLVGNAVKFTEEGSVRIVVACSLGAHPRVSFRVVDTGIGIAADKVGHLFEPFMQADSSTTRKYGGTGLGLGICQQLAAMLGGEIRIESAPDQGSTFTFTIDPGPLDGVAMVRDFEEAGSSAVCAPAESVASIVGTRILLAEDGLDNQRLLSMHLRKGGAEVSIADNGRIAVELVEAARAEGRPFDVVLMDMQMPELDGYGATAKLRTRGFVLPIIALTAHAMASDRARCLAAGCDDYLTKPIQRVDLLAAVARFIRPRAASPIITSELADDEDMAEIIAEFVAEMPKRITALREANNSADHELLRRLAHQLTGAAGGYGFGALGEVAARLEAAVGRSDVAARVGELVSMCGRVRVTPPNGTVVGATLQETRA